MSAKVILLIEDNPSDVALTERALQRNNLSNTLVLAQDGQEGDFVQFSETVRQLGLYWLVLNESP